MARKMIRVRVATAEGFVDIPPTEVVAMEMRPYPHVARLSAEGHVIHYLNFPIEMTEEASEIEIANVLPGGKLST